MIVNPTWVLQPLGKIAWQHMLPPTPGQAFAAKAWKGAPQMLSEIGQMRYRFLRMRALLRKALMCIPSHFLQGYFAIGTKSASAPCLPICICMLYPSISTSLHCLLIGPCFDKGRSTNSTSAKQATPKKLCVQSIPNFPAFKKLLLEVSTKLYLEPRQLRATT